MSQIDTDVFMADRALAVLSSNWQSNIRDGGLSETGGCIIPQFTWNSFQFRAGDFAIATELCVSPTGTPPTDPGVSTPTGWTILSTQTFTDGSGRGCRVTMMAKILVSTDPGSVVRYCALPAAGANCYRQIIMRAFYMNRPVQSFTSGGQVGDMVSTDPSSKTILGGAENSTSAYDLFLSACSFQGVINMSDAQTSFTPVKGTEYFDYDGMTRAVAAGDDGITTSAKIKYNAYTRGDTTANMSFDMIDTGTLNVQMGRWYKLK